MKKILMGLIVISTSVLAYENTNIYLKTGIDISGKFDDKEISPGQYTNKSTSVDCGFEFSTEITKEIYPNLELGLGISYQDHNKPESIINFEQGKIQNTGYNSFPIYTVAKYNIPTESNIKPYVKADLGYSFNFNEEDLKTNDEKVKTSINNGLYYGVGAGVEYNNFIFELIYKVNKADIQYEIDGIKTAKQNYNYSRTTLSIGYKFN